MTMKRICDSCGIEMEKPEIRLTFKDHVEQKTKKGTIKTKVVTRTLDFCNKECFDKFVQLWAEVAKQAKGGE